MICGTAFVGILYVFNFRPDVFRDGTKSPMAEVWSTYLNFHTSRFGHRLLSRELDL